MTGAAVSVHRKLEPARPMMRCRALVPPEARDVPSKAAALTPRPVAPRSSHAISAGSWAGV
eukprot:CAMPEP_0119110820 /NCGR_PEP_ID=MMETSP1180-20130426/32248_1 /TAXON_ID=3052 ORGANISM="Chlamydomonas cf sp, Strain CCMP681" /NCGR_SAMPLE_ID=MMETSP1180 /ASSEMBLY_ACC=CAM_ASM_000741 /LENGTH=60 /DNA_ID=CAMNT_0007097405 /DNA_START=661 /DNA_END=839 /DNA_ORIENTATION=-